MPMIMPREKNMAPDRNGLFTIKQVAVLAADRNLMTFDTENANVCEVVHGIYRDRIQIPAYNECEGILDAQGNLSTHRGRRSHERTGRAVQSKAARRHQN